MESLVRLLYRKFSEIIIYKKLQEKYDVYQSRHQVSICCDVGRMFYSESLSVHKSLVYVLQFFHYC